jgi:diguanylate cyclase (GGDEF)-like protein
VRFGFYKRMHRSIRVLRGWPVFENPSWLVVFLGLVVAAWAAAVIVGARAGSLSGHQLIVLGGLLACIAATLELTRRVGENAGLTSDVYGVWHLPAAVLLPPVYAMTVPLLSVFLTQLRIRRMPVHRRVFTGAVLGLSFGAASFAFRSIGPHLGWTPWRVGFLWVLAVAAAAIMQWALNWVLLLPAIKGSDPAVRLRKLIFTREIMENDVTELCVAVLVTCSIAVSALTIVFALPFVTLLQRSFRHAQLVNASRVDSKTGLLNAGTWEREAAAEVARAVRTRTPLAVALIDVDHFKAVNDVNGHLAGDKALKAIARTLTLFLREYDLVGRFGGEEFALLLPQTVPVDAYRIAERIRTHIGAMPIDISDIRSEPIKLTISVGVASLGARWDTASGSQLTDLLAGADSALYQAKRDGRDRVCVITENATYGTRTKPAEGLLASDLSSGDDIAAIESAEEVPEDWQISLESLGAATFEAPV